MWDILLSQFYNMSFIEMFFKASVFGLALLMIFIKPKLKELDLDGQLGIQEMFFDNFRFFIYTTVCFIFVPALIIEIFVYTIDFISSSLYWKFYYFFEENAKLYFNFSTIVILATFLNFRDRILQDIARKKRFTTCDDYTTMLEIKIDKCLYERLNKYSREKGWRKREIVEEAIRSYISEKRE